MRAGGMAQTPAFRSISSHVARRTSPDRAAVSTRNSNARWVVTGAWEARTVARASATAPWGSARMCRTTVCCRLSVSNSSSGRRWKLDHAPAVGDPTHMVEFGTGRRAFAREA